MRYLIITLFFLSSILFAQVEHSRNTHKFELLPTFYFDVANYMGEKENASKIDVFIQVPYSSVQFVKNEGGFVSRYNLTVTFYDEDKDNILIERIWKEKISVEDFSKTTSEKSFNVSYRSFSLPPGEYPIRIIVEDADSKKSFKTEATLNVAAFDDLPSISDVVLISRFVNDNENRRIIPNISRRVTSDDDKLSFFFEAYSEKERTVKFEYIIKDSEDATVLKQERVKKLTKGTETIYETIENIKLTLGEYTLYVHLIDESGDIIIGRKKEIFSQIYGLPRTVTDLDKAIEQMLYIASDDELDSIKEADKYNEKLKRYKEFWQEKDPSPNDNINEILYEYYRRIHYANENFESYYEGWRTDMGMVYVILGPPDHVERHPFELETKPYEVWDYYEINKRFVFVDETGFGDYRLLNPVFGDWYRYRQN